MNYTSFPAPTEELELSIVEFMQNKLEIPFGDFWYKWFQHGNSENQNLHLFSNKKLDAGKLKELLKSNPIEGLNIILIFKVIECSGIRRFGEDFDYLYVCHIKTDLNGIPTHFQTKQKKQIHATQI